MIVPWIQMLLLIALIGFIAWALVTFVPMPPKFRTAIVALAGLVAVLFLLYAFGLIPAPRGWGRG